VGPVGCFLVFVGAAIGWLVWTDYHPRCFLHICYRHGSPRP
jgi:hypothetical protein